MPYKDIETRRASARAWRAKHKDKFRAYIRAWKARHKDRVRLSRQRHYIRHREERLAYQQSYAIANPGKVRANTRRYQARKCGAAIGPVDYECIKRRDQMVCCICGIKVTKKDLSFDHIIPLSAGGPHVDWNIRVAHRVCNSRKGTGCLPSQPYLPGLG